MRLHSITATALRCCYRTLPGSRLLPHFCRALYYHCTSGESVCATALLSAVLLSGAPAFGAESKNPRAASPAILIRGISTKIYPLTGFAKTILKSPPRSLFVPHGPIRVNLRPFAARFSVAFLDNTRGRAYGAPYFYKHIVLHKYKRIVLITAFSAYAPDSRESPHSPPSSFYCCLS
jgi:hypothetical protein